MISLETWGYENLRLSHSDENQNNEICWIKVPHLLAPGKKILHVTFRKTMTSCVVIMFYWRVECVKAVLLVPETKATNVKENYGNIEVLTKKNILPVSETVFMWVGLSRKGDYYITKRKLVHKDKVSYLDLQIISRISCLPPLLIKLVLMKSSIR